ncbi:MAG TPA: SCO6880 family protein [Solirubrobacterales bacterium]|nr:SCO6880 family protein [Solirubrobacterales bacterium]
MSARRYRFGPLEQRGVVGPLRISQVVVLGVAAVLALGALYGIRGWGGMCVAILLLVGAGATIYLPIEGRTIAEWAPVAMRWALRSGEEKRGYRSSSPGAGVRVGADGKAMFESSLPDELEGLELLEVPYGSDRVGVIRDRRAGTYTAALAVRAGAFGLLDVREQERKLDGWGSVLASLARDGSPVRRLQWIERTLPAEGDELASYLQGERDRAVPLDSGLVASYIELLESAAPVTQEHEILLALQIDERRGAREMRRMGGGVDAACELLLREAENLAERLSLAEVTVYGLLRPRRYAAAIRDAFDPFGRQGRSRAALGDPDREGTDPALMGPLADNEQWSSYRTDSAHHITAWISSWPRTDVGAAFLTPLLMQTTALRTVSVCIEPVSHSTAVRRAEAARTAEVAEEMQRERQGFLTSARIRRRQQAAARREEELADGHAEMIFASYLGFDGRTLEEAERHFSEGQHAAALARLEVQRLHGEQQASFMNLLPIGWGLR